MFVLMMRSDIVGGRRRHEKHKSRQFNETILIVNRFISMFLCL
jgi:hypothetical protein